MFALIANNRLSKIENNTFSHFDELSRLNLAGNRLTSTFRTEYFVNNLYLNEIWIADNPWHCECNDKSFKEFYHFVLENEVRRICDGTKLGDGQRYRSFSDSERSFSTALFFAKICI